MKRILFIAIYLITQTVCDAQQRYIVSFNDKGELSVSNRQNLVSVKSYSRRKLLNKKNDWYDCQIRPEYLASVSRLGKIIQTSKWLNACVVESDINPAAFLALPEVKKIESVQYTFYSEGLVREKQNELSEIGKQGTIYGKGDTVIQRLNIWCMHEVGFTGDNVTVAFIDAGFSGLDTISFFKKLFMEGRIDYTYDFCSDTSYVYYKNAHGMSCLGGVAAEKENEFIGVAPSARFLLFITDDATETKLDEFNYVKALEVADSLGADVVSASLSYKVFDPGVGDYTYQDMDGNTALSTRGVDIAASRGMIVVGSAGNDGFICAPCDADSGLCVGGAFSNGQYDLFSSRGPTFDHRIKPDVAGITRNVNYINKNGQIDIMSYGGTSIACPMVAGVAILLRQAHPDKNNMEIIDAIKKSGIQYLNPDSLVGFGLPNACKADSILNGLLAVDEVKWNQADITLFPNPSNEECVIRSTGNIECIEIISAEGKSIFMEQFVQVNQYRLSTRNLNEGVYFVKVTDTSRREKMLRFVKI